MARFSSALLFLGAIAPLGEAQASSLIVLQASDGSIGPSVVVIGASTPASPRSNGAAGAGSIVAVGEAPPAVSQEKLSSITGDAPKRPDTTPMMIRGGIVGETLPRKPAKPSAEPRAAEKAPAPSPAGQDIGPSPGSENSPH